METKRAKLTCAVRDTSELSRCLTSCEFEFRTLSLLFEVITEPLVSDEHLPKDVTHVRFMEMHHSARYTE